MQSYKCFWPEYSKTEIVDVFYFSDDIGFDDDDRADIDAMKLNDILKIGNCKITRIK